MSEPNTPIDVKLRERLEMAGCYVEKRASGGETWFTPHRNRHFHMMPPVGTAAEANAILREAGMEEVFS